AVAGRGGERHRFRKRLACRRQLEPARERCKRLVFRRSEEHTSELQSQSKLVCRLLLEKKKHERPRSATCAGGRRRRPPPLGCVDGPVSRGCLCRRLDMQLDTNRGRLVGVVVLLTCAN